MLKTPVILLYLEDDEMDRRAFLRMARDKGLPYEMTVAETLAEARAHLTRSSFDVIVADYHLPDGLGTELFAEAPQTPFVLLTGTLEEQLALRTLERGADDYLPKDEQQRHLEAVPFAVEKCLHRKLLRDKEHQLTRELQASREELARANAELERKVQERTAKLQEMMAELEHMSYSIIHDLRAPLRAVQSLSKILEQEAAERLRPEEQEYLERIRNSTNRMDQLIRDVLNYHQVVKSELPVSAVELEPLLRGVLDSYPELRLSRADIRLEGSFPKVAGNPAGLTQCFSQLLQNAIKFVAPGVKPQVRVWAEGREANAAALAHEHLGRRPSPAHQGSAKFEQGVIKNHQPPTSTTIRVWVEDNGIGIPHDAQQKIFGMFQRVHGASEYPGTGMGLAIARKAVQRMGGRLGLESEPGKGSRFWVELPKAPEAMELAA
jgi:signal transduction histidine kinase